MLWLVYVLDLQLRSIQNKQSSIPSFASFLSSVRLLFTSSSFYKISKQHKLIAQFHKIRKAFCEAYHVNYWNEICRCDKTVYREREKKTTSLEENKLTP